MPCASGPRPNRISRSSRFSSEDGEEELSVTCRELDARARALGAFLSLLGLAGERAVLSFRRAPSTSSLSSAASTVAGRRHGLSAALLARVGAAAVDLCGRHAARGPHHGSDPLAIRSGTPSGGDRRRRSLDRARVGGAAGSRALLEPSILRPDDLALLQYTSGSTSDPPAGSWSPTATCCRNEALIRDAFAQQRRIGDRVLAPARPRHGADRRDPAAALRRRPLHLMVPVTFLQRPRPWLEAISRYRETTSGGPNFAYDLCVRASSPRPNGRGWISRSGELAFNGAEPVHADTLERFATPSPLRASPATFLPCYGLAEATLLVTGSPAHPASIRVATADRRATGFASRRPGKRRARWSAAARRSSRWSPVDPQTGGAHRPGPVGRALGGGSRRGTRLLVPAGCERRHLRGPPPGLPSPSCAPATSASSPTASCSSRAASRTSSSSGAQSLPPRPRADRRAEPPGLRPGACRVHPGRRRRRGGWWSCTRSTGTCGETWGCSRERSAMPCCASTRSPSTRWC